MSSRPSAVGADNTVSTTSVNSGTSVESEALKRAKEIAARLNNKLRDEGKISRDQVETKEHVEALERESRKRDVELVLGSVDPLKRIALGGYETIKHEWQIPDAMVGLIIGKGGETIREIGQRTACDVQIAPHPPPGSNQRPVTLTGSREAINNAINLMESILHQVGVAVLRDHLQTPGSIIVPSGSNLDEIAIPNSTVGYVIGKGGECVREIQTRSGARVQIDQYNTTGQNRTISITGTPEQIAEARRLILEKIKEFEGTKTVVDVAAYQYPIHAQVVGVVIGPNGATIRELGNVSGARLQVSPGQVNDVRFIAISGTEEQKAVARRMIDDIVNQNAISTGTRFTIPPISQDMIAQAHQGTGFSGMKDRDLDKANAPTTLSSSDPAQAVKFVMFVTNSYVGLLIGKGGETVKSMQDMSQTRIQIDPPTNSDMRKVTIMGLSHFVENARQMIERKMLDSGAQVKYPEDQAPIPGVNGVPGGTPAPPLQSSASGYQSYGGPTGFSAPYANVTQVPMQMPMQQRQADPAQYYQQYQQYYQQQAPAQPAAAPAAGAAPTAGNTPAEQQAFAEAFAKMTPEQQAYYEQYYAQYYQQYYQQYYAAQGGAQTAPPGFPTPQTDGNAKTDDQKTS